MARCHGCGEEIGYGAYWKGILACYGRNMWRRSLPVFDCPHCGTSCQETVLTSMAFTLLCTALGLGALLLAGAWSRVHESLDIMAAFAVAAVILHYAWWRLVSRTRAPCRFFWE